MDARRWRSYRRDGRDACGGKQFAGMQADDRYRWRRDDDQQERNVNQRGGAASMP